MLKQFSLLILGTAFLVGCGGAVSKVNKGPVDPNNPFNDPQLPEGPACVSAKLQWDPPVKYSDGAPVLPGDIVGYRIHIGERSKAYSNELIAFEPDISTYTVPSLTQNKRYYFAVRAISKSGLVSDYSNEASKFFTECVRESEINEVIIPNPPSREFGH